ncbi:hypothetical protein P9239_14415 [Caballeronia sp. LZ062]|uniref:hypothetical protein n=1 Tax=unclassified Caballeronia TaxID=2646786 RepID=UPI00285D8E35|nr:MULTISPECIES: hypothetical protein [unclassified Caballeronia]MDR5853931.1 hypothetical protein [Caballeronia sp. LZ050]MDR5871538.1 hypothetical protein [Caballeronia sp. LZ062]
MNHLTRLAQWCKSFANSSTIPGESSLSSIAFEPAWHGDHWQNLLSSPMDARRYVMEDWATPLDDDLVPAQTTDLEAL